MESDEVIYDHLTPSKLINENTCIGDDVGVFFFSLELFCRRQHQILPLNSDKRSTLYKGKSTIPVIDEIEEEPVEFRFVNCAAGRDRVIPVSHTVRKD